MDVTVFIGLGAAAGVMVLLFLVARLIRAVRHDDDFDFARRRRFAWRPHRRSSRRSSIAQPRVALSNEGAELPPFTLASPLVERLKAHAPSYDPEAPPDARETLSDVSEATSDVPEAASDVPEAPEVLAQVSPPAIPSTRSEPVKLSRQSKDDQAREGEDQAKEQSSMANSEARADGGGLSDYSRLGEQVTAVLTSAERAAADIREAANRKAEEVRLAAENDIAQAKTQAEWIRTEADVYRDETKDAADSYADETRRKADADAASARAEGEDMARAVEADARRKAKEIEAEALRRRDELRQSAMHLEERIGELLGTFRTMTAELEGLLPADDKRRSGKSDENADVVDDTLEDALKPERIA